MMDMTTNYQALAQAIVLTAMEDAQGDGPEALMASQWLEHVDFELVGLAQVQVGESLTQAGNDDF
ncbi:MAG: hypothetical protein HC884_05840 [Chloroflexaceae bacterium]|nr:hypothetical protein [Chloroflexaceae bacterium]